MIILDEPLLQLFRERRACEFCGKALRCRAEPHHIFTRGAGRLDVPINLIALGNYTECLCHRRASNMVNGKWFYQERFIRKVAAREGITSEQLRAEIYLLRALPKGSDYARAQASFRKGEVVLVNQRRYVRSRESPAGSPHSQPSLEADEAGRF